MSKYGIRPFLKHFFKNPLSTGAIVPSSKTLGKKIVELIESDKRGVLAEFGPGTGAITPFILQKLNPGSRFFAIERNEDFYKIFKSKFPNVTIFHDSIENVESIVKKQSLDRIDTIVSSLPWVSFPPHLQEHFLKLIHEVLTPGGTFITFGYIHGVFLPSGINLRKLLNKMFQKVDISSIIWKNIPPAIIYKCKK